MIASIVYLVCMIWIPRTFKNTGIRYVVQDKLQGVWLIMLSKTLWWLALLNLALVWLPQWQTYIVIICGLGLSYSIYKDKKYVLFDLEKLGKVK